MACDVSYYLSAVSTGFVISRPPNLTDKDMICRSTSDACLSIMAGIRVSLMQSSSGENRCFILGIVR